MASAGVRIRDRSTGTAVADDATVKTGLPPGPRLPRALQTARFLLREPRFMESCRDRYGDVFTVDLIGRAVHGPGAAQRDPSWVFLADPEHVRQVFTADPAVVLAGETNVFLLGAVGPRSILVLDEPEHMTQRKLMLPAFHGERVHAYRELISEVARAELDRWPQGRPFSLWPRMQAITLEVIVRAVFGISEPRRLAHVRDVLRAMLNRMTKPGWLAAHMLFVSLAGTERVGGSRSVRRLLGPVDDAVFSEIRRRRLATDLDERDDVLSMLMLARSEDGSSMSDDDLHDELMTLLIAGHESTATALAWAFERLARHPDALDRLRAEAHGGEHDYADAVVKETLRLRPVVPFVLRKLAAPMELGGYRLAPGTWVAPCAYLVHRREDVYPEPARFRPERFLERPAGTYTWIPFGGGVRRCLGASFAQLEMRQVLRAVVAHADLEPETRRPERIASRFITLAPARGARVVRSP